MNPNFNFHLFDFAVHIIPGSVIVLLFSIFLPQEVTSRFSDTGLKTIGVVFIAVYACGFLNHAFMTTYQGFIERFICRSRLLELYIRRNKSYDIAKELIGKQERWNTDSHLLTPIGLFLYAQMVIAEKAPACSEMALRVDSLGWCSRNLVCPLGLFIVYFFGTYLDQYSVIIFIAAFGTALLLIHIWSVYWRRSIDHVFNAFVYVLLSNDKPQRENISILFIIPCQAFFCQSPNQFDYVQLPII